MADTGDDVLFQSPVEHANKPHILTLAKYQLSWDATSKCKLHEGNTLEPLIRKYIDNFYAKYFLKFGHEKYLSQENESSGLGN